MCACCLSHLLADARLKDETPTCPGCRCEISRTLCSRNLAVEKAISELPALCQFCARLLPRCTLPRHESEICQQRFVRRHRRHHTRSAVVDSVVVDDCVCVVVCARYCPFAEHQLCQCLCSLFAVIDRCRSGHDVLRHPQQRRPLINIPQFWRPLTSSARRLCGQHLADGGHHGLHVAVVASVSVSVSVQEERLGDAVQKNPYFCHSCHLQHFQMPIVKQFLGHSPQKQLSCQIGQAFSSLMLRVKLASI